MKTEKSTDRVLSDGDENQQLRPLAVMPSLQSDKPILDACCGGRMFWLDKNNENVLFIDQRRVEKGAFPNNWNPNWEVQPDVIADFRNLPFADKSFKMVVYDPPHLESGSMKGVINTKYGILPKGEGLQYVVDGFNESWRCVDDFGVLIFKWAEANIKTSDLLKSLPVKPLFGDLTGKTGKTIWMTFMKIPSVSSNEA